MKKLYLIVLSFLITNLLFSQSTDFKSKKEKDIDKPELFQHDEKQIQINNGFFNKVFSYKLGDTLQLQLTPNVSIRGTVISAIFTEDFDIISIASIDVMGLRLLLSHKHFNTEDEYFGFTLCVNHKDGLKLEKDKETGSYLWIKKEMSEIIPD